MKWTSRGITAPLGFVANGLTCGIKRSKKKDLTLVVSQAPCISAGVFTTNKVQASCVIINKKRLAKGKAQAIIANSGNANCLTGKRGFVDSLTMTARTAKLLRVSASHVCVASTGVIGRALPIKKITAALPELVEGLSKKGGRSAAQGIMTTDHVPKEAALEVGISGRRVRIGAIAKGGGMIHPNMATMLCFVATDAKVQKSALQSALSAAVSKTFNMITVDGDMSTNDMVMVLANGLADNKPIVQNSREYKVFAEALESLFLKLAKMMILDAEGATKSVEIVVKNAASAIDARTVARSIASSNLVKCALFGGDPNWGRIAAAAGYSGAKVDQWKMKVYLGKILVLKAGGAVLGTRKGGNPFAQKEIVVTVDLGLGKHGATAYTCDLSTDYVVFNSAYHT